MGGINISISAALISKYFCDGGREGADNGARLGRAIFAILTLGRVVTNGPECCKVHCGVGNMGRVH